ncbi:hepatitis A virus cellular receptor 1 homolog [Mixophyes fleayi]|uniref:hepatitis A virus cellular receptor 1 homolog n=1 Tax=Mixophyes fleayi TaxID=3061075 RepID=UPI003F4E2148
MTLLSLWMTVLLLSPSASMSADNVTGSVDETLTLPCSYSVSDGTTTMCWGRGICPSSKCNDEIIWTDGSTVNWRKSDRYQLLGNISQGDVSLTITGVTEEDEGTYCCRVEIPGLFNDKKKQIIVMLHDIEECPDDSDLDPTNEESSPTLTPSI